MWVREVSEEVARVATATLLLPLALTITCLMFVATGIFAPPAYEITALTSYLSTLVVSQPLFAAVAAWLAYTREVSDGGKIGLFRSVFTLVLGVAVADCAWVVGFFCVEALASLSAGAFSGGPVLPSVLAIAAVPAVAFALVSLVVGPSCVAAAAVGCVCGRAAREGRGGRFHSGAVASAVAAVAYCGLLAATWAAGSVEFSGAAYASEEPKLLSILWLTGASIGCAVVLAAVSVQPNCGRMRRFVFLGAAMLGFLVGGGILFHLSMERAGGEIWSALFVTPATGT